MKCIQSYNRVTSWISGLKDLPLFFIRIVLAYGFYNPAIMKWNNIASIAEWFDGMGFPMPTLNAYLAATTEMAAVILLPLGLATRIISIPLMITMLVAVFAVHYSNGFNAGDNGFEIPLYYLLMIFMLFVNGAGKISLDHLIGKKIKA